MNNTTTTTPTLDHNTATTVMKATVDTMFNLKARWADEHEYEDFADYSAVIEKIVNGIPGATFISMKKRPFSFRWRGADGFVRESKLTRNAIETRRYMNAAR